MPAHEQKHCPRCSKAFECKVGDIAHCQCNGLSFTLEEKSFIEERYTDCLCASCLIELKNKSTLFNSTLTSQKKEFVEWVKISELVLM